MANKVSFWDMPLQEKLVGLKSSQKLSTFPVQVYARNNVNGARLVISVDRTLATLSFQNQSGDTIRSQPQDLAHHTYPEFDLTGLSVTLPAGTQSAIVPITAIVRDDQDEPVSFPNTLLLSLAVGE